MESTITCSEFPCYLSKKKSKSGQGIGRYNASHTDWQGKGQKQVSNTHMPSRNPKSRIDSTHCSAYQEGIILNYHTIFMQGTRYNLLDTFHIHFLLQTKQCTVLSILLSIRWIVLY